MDQVGEFLTQTVQQTCTGARSVVHERLDAGVSVDALPALWVENAGICEPLMGAADNVYFALSEPVDFAMFMAGVLSE
jgi:hypothetical protein